MAIPRWVARVNRRATNHITAPIARHTPGFGVIIHRGRKTHQLYRTPVNVFAAPGGYTVALTYGTESQWVKNVIAAGGCDLQTRGRVEHLAAGSVFRDESRASVPWLARKVLALLRVADFLSLTRPPPRPPEGDVAAT
ncbi:MAG TPA: nitroreductase family deazaflavin-dependent oxidoreductase [Propionibacteriaceae bacterium]|nr:nitroreductase family deazaflavin-dependent oxidoreductase [Propionibacteriaceae bacterium]